MERPIYSGKYYLTIGLEIHAELKTKTKMFSRALNNPDEEEPNQNIDPVSLAHPGTLPVVNKKALEHMIRIGLAVGGNVANFTEFDRKNYFYPDIPKGYQISQYKHPIVSGGSLAGVALTRIHLEEDTGTNKHEAGHSLVDFNRAGVPLAELVTEPVIYSPEQVSLFAKEFQLLLRTLGAGDANLQKGEMRVEVNLSVSDDPARLGTKVEVKNIGSFKAAEAAARYEMERHIGLLEDGRGNEIVQETRGWDENKLVTISQRSKENSEEYRYFPDPDIPKFYLHEMFDIEKMRGELPELPWEKRTRLQNLGIKDADIEILIGDAEIAPLFEYVADKSGGDKEILVKASNYLCSDLIGYRTNIEGFRYPDKESFAKLISMVSENLINSRAAKDILLILSTEGGDPEHIAEERGMLQLSDEGAIRELVQKVINANPDQAAGYKAGNENLLKFLMGQVMRESGGTVNPEVATEVLKKLLS
jgi:aspartyl-tRNA(Asn)/glutamyl-tRNA(Gln) amidotransferase subunit B